MGGRKGLPSALCPLPSVLCHLSFVICPLQPTEVSGHRPTCAGSDRSCARPGFGGVHPEKPPAAGRLRPPAWSPHSGNEDPCSEIASASPASRPVVARHSLKASSRIPAISDLLSSHSPACSRKCSIDRTSPAEPREM